MIPFVPASASHRPAPPPLVLIGEDDPRVLELLQLAFTQENFRVVTAVDGDEVLRRAMAERPDLVVLDVRMPQRNGFEVCDHLRHDPEDPNVPIVMLSASGETEVRIEGLTRGADDFLAKPFSPKELVARSRRLLARAAESRAHRRRAAELERDLNRAHDEARRAGRDLARERRLRELAYGLGRDLQGTLDLDALAARTLRAALRQLGATGAAWLAPAETGGVFAVQAFEGPEGVRFASLALPAGGEIAARLAGLGRPVTITELERSRGLRESLAPLAAAGVALLAPLRSDAGLEAVIATDERADGAAWSPEDREALGALADLAATALRNARRLRAAQDRELELAAQRAQVSPRARAAAAEAWTAVATAAHAVALPGRDAGLLRHAVAFGAWAWDTAGRATLAEMEALDPTGRVRELRELTARGETLELEAALAPGPRHAALLAALGARYQVGRASGRSAIESWDTALAWVGPALDPELATAMREALAPPPRERAPAHAA